MSDLSVRFKEPTIGGLTGAQSPAEPTVGGRTGSQWSQLHLWEDDHLCAHELFPKDQQGPAEYCGNVADPDSDFCSDHNPDRHEPDYDSIGKEMRLGIYDD